MTTSKHRYASLSEYLTVTGLSQEAFASSIGISTSYVSLIMNGQRIPSLPVALKIAAAANIPVESLLPTETAASPW